MNIESLISQYSPINSEAKIELLLSELINFKLFNLQNKLEIHFHIKKRKSQEYFFIAGINLRKNFFTNGLSVQITFFTSAQAVRQLSGREKFRIIRDDAIHLNNILPRSFVNQAIITKIF